MKQRSFILLVCLGFLLQTKAEEHKVGTWLSANTSLGFTPAFSLSFRSEYCANNNFKNSDYLFVRITAQYSLCPYFALGASYENFTTFHANPKSYTNWHRAFANASASYNYKNWSFCLLERFVYGYAPSTGKMNYTLRSLFDIGYQIPNKPLKPYITTEFFNDVEAGNNFRLKDISCYAGVRFDCNKNHALQFYYCWNLNTASQTHLHIIGLDYIFSWQRKK